MIITNNDETVKLSRNAINVIKSLSEEKKAKEQQYEWDAKLELLDGSEVELFYVERHKVLDESKNYTTRDDLSEQLFGVFDGSLKDRKTLRYKDGYGTDIHVFKDKIVKVHLR